MPIDGVNHRIMNKAVFYNEQVKEFCIEPSAIRLKELKSFFVSAVQSRLYYFCFCGESKTYSNSDAFYNHINHCMCRAGAAEINLASTTLQAPVIKTGYDIRYL